MVITENGLGQQDFPDWLQVVIFHVSDQSHSGVEGIFICLLSYKQIYKYSNSDVQYFENPD